MAERLGLCRGCRGLGWFRRDVHPGEWVCPGCTDRGGGPPLSPREFSYLRALRGRHEGFSNGDLNYLYSLMVRGEETKKCECCNEKSVAVDLVPSRTMYAKPHLVSWKRLLLEDEGLGEVPDPNQPSWLCRSCAEDYQSHWDDMWSNVSYL